MQLFEDGAGALVLFFARSVKVGDGTDKNFFARVPFFAINGVVSVSQSAIGIHEITDLLTYFHSIYIPSQVKNSCAI